MADLPPVITKRNEFGSISAISEDAIGRYPEEGRIVTREELLRLLNYFGEKVSSECQTAFQKGAERGIDQARKLMIDPDYYATVKERRKRSQQRYAEDQERQRIENMERDEDPEYRAKRITDMRKWIDEAKANLSKLNTRLTEYLKRYETPPKLVRLPIPDNIPNWHFKGLGQTIDTGIPGSFTGLKAVPDAPVVQPEEPGIPTRVK